MAVRSLPRAPLIICDGCRRVLEPTLTQDESDPMKGLWVSEMWEGECKDCKYQFSIHVKQEADDERKILSHG